MKKITLLILVTLFCIPAFSQFKFGGGASMGTAYGWGNEKVVPNIGLNVRGLYEISDWLSLTAGISYYFKTKGMDNGVALTEKNMIVFNLGTIYYFYDDGDKRFYGLGNITINHYEWHYTGDVNKFNDIGADVGVGVEYSRFFLELKCDGTYNQFVATIGAYL